MQTNLLVLRLQQSTHSVKRCGGVINKYRGNIKNLLHPGTSMYLLSWIWQSEARCDEGFREAYDLNENCRSACLNELRMERLSIRLYRGTNETVNHLERVSLSASYSSFVCVFRH